MIQNEGSCRCRGFSLGLHHSRLPGARGQVSETRFSQSQPSSQRCSGLATGKVRGELPHGCGPHAATGTGPPRLPPQPARGCQRLLFLQLPPLHSGEGPARACFQITAIFNPFSYPSPSGVLRGPARFPSPPPVLRSDRGTQCSPDTFPAHYTGHLKPFRTKCSRALR